MSCYNPLLAYMKKIDDKYDVQILHRTRYFDSELHRQRVMQNAPTGYKLCSLPCGKCIGCKLDRSRDWATRLITESKSYPDNSCWFITFTYDPEHIIINEFGVETVPKKKEFSKFIKKMRSSYDRLHPWTGDDIEDNPYRFKFFAAAEYGEQYSRPHVHCIFLNLQFEDLQLVNPDKEIYSSAWLSDLWKNGLIAIQPFTYENAAYTARYCLKKLSIDAEEYRFREAEWVNMSQGIAREYLLENLGKIYLTDSIVVRSGSLGHEAKVPRYFDKKLKEIDPDKYDEIKASRAKKSEDVVEIKVARNKSNLTDILCEEEKAKAAAILSLKRNFERGVDIY